MGGRFPFAWSCSFTVSPDPKWLELLKASGWQTLAIATGCSLTYALISRGIIPNPGALAILFVVVLGLICACLTLPNILSRLARTFPILKWIRIGNPPVERGGALRTTFRSCLRETE